MTQASQGEVPADTPIAQPNQGEVFPPTARTPSPTPKPWVEQVVD